MNVSNNTSPAEGIPLGSLTPGQDPAVHDSNTGAENFGASGLPRAMLASGIPRIVIMDENAVYDHYMRRLNRVWMRRIQASRTKARVDSNRRPRSPDFNRVEVRPNVRPNVVPAFVHGMDDPNRARRHRGRPSSAAVDSTRKKSSARESAIAGHRPKSAPIFISTPTAAWAGMMDRNHAAIGPGATSSRCRHYHGDNHVTRRTNDVARPDSAPNLRNSRDRHTAPSDREHSKPNKQSVPAWSAPRLTHLERETHDLLKVCRKAARSKGNPTRWCNYRQDRAIGELPRPGDERRRKGSDLTNAMMSRSSTDFRPDEKIEDLGRGAVVRFIGGLGMGRYAHRFRAFAVTGSDLASCTEEDLIQIGVSFRPHRIRLLKEIKRRRGRQKSKDVACQDTNFVARTDSWETTEGLTPVSTSNKEDASLIQHQDYGNRDPAAHLPREHLSNTSSNSCVPNKGSPKTLRKSGSSNTLRSSDALESSSMSTMCTTFERGSDKHSTIPGTQQLPQAVRASTSMQTELCISTNDRPLSAEAGESSTDVETPKSENRGGGREFVPTVDENAGLSVGGDKDRTAEKTSQTLRVATDRTMDARSGPSVERGHAAARMKGILEVSGVGAANVRVALGGRDRFVRVRTCDQLRRADYVQDKGTGTTLSGAVLSFSVTDEDLAAGGIQVELCDGGTVGASNPVASGTIPGDVTLQLIRRSRPNCEASSDDDDRGPTGLVDNGIAVGVRLFAKTGGEDAGVCTLNLKFNPDVEGPTRTSALSNSSREPSATEGLSRDVSEAGKTEAGTSTGNGERQSSFLLLEEAARHVEAIEEVCERVRRQREAVEYVGSEEYGRNRLVQVAGEIRPVALDQREVVRDAPPPVVGRRFSIEQQHDAVIVLQSHTRRRAAEKVVRMRVKERVAANRVQAFARQRMAVAQVRQARERELEAMRQQSKAAVKLQSTARRRFAAKTAQRRRSEMEEIVAEKHNTAAVQIQGIVRHRAKKREEHRAATTLQGMAKVHEAKVEAVRRKLERLEVALRMSEEAAASQIQTFTRRHTRAHERRVAQDVAERRRAAVKLQSVARSRSARREVKAVCTVARAMMKDVWTQAFERHMTLLATEKGRVAAKLQRLENKRAAAVAAAAQFTVDEAEIQMCHAVAQERMSPSTEVETALQEVLVHSDGEADGDDGRALAKVQSTARDITAMEETKSREQAVNAESLRLAEVAEESVKENEAAMHIQRLCRLRQENVTELAQQAKASADAERRLEVATGIQHFCRQQIVAGSARSLESRVDQSESVEGMGVEPGDRLGDAIRHSDKEKHRAAAKVQRLARKRQRAVKHRTKSVSPTGIPAICTSLVTQELLDSRREENAAMCIQNAFREWRLMRQAALFQEQLGIENQRQQAAECIQRGVRMFRAKKTVAGLRRQEDLEMQEHVQCVQRGFRVSQANKQVSTLRRRRERQDEDMVRQTAAATRIQQAARVSQAVERRAALRRQRDIDTERRVKLELEKNAATQVEAAACIQRAVRRRLAVNRVAILRRQRDMDIQRAVQVESEEREAAECIQRSVRRKKAGETLTSLRKERDNYTHRRREEHEREKQLEARSQDAAGCIQRVARCRQALVRVNTLRAKRDSDMRHKLEHDKQLEARKRGAAGDIQRAVRCRQALARVDALRAKRDSDIRRKQEHEKKLEVRRRSVVEYVQWVCHQALARVDALRAKRDSDVRHKLEHEKKLEARKQGAAKDIQRAVRRRQALARVDALRAKRDGDIRHKLEHERQLEVRRRGTAEYVQWVCHQALERVALRAKRDSDVRHKLEHEKILEARKRGAAEGIQQAVRCRQALARVDALRAKRDSDIRRKLEQEKKLEARRRGAAEYVQWVCHQALVRVNALRANRDSDIRHKQEHEKKLEARRRGAVECIQRAVRCRQAIVRVDASRRMRDRDNRRNIKEETDEEEERAAATCIQRVERSRRAVKRVSSLRRQREVEIERKLEKELAKYDAVACIQRSVRKKQANDRVSALRRRRSEVKSKLKQNHGVRTAARRDAAECIQRATRCKQACARVSFNRHQKETELERQTVTQREAAECIQRAVRVGQATKRVNTKKMLKRHEMQHDLELEQEMQAAVRRKAIERIQRVVRVHQAASLVFTLRRQRDLDTQEKEKRTAVQYEAAAVVLQRCQRQRAAVERVEHLRQERARQERERQEEAEQESVSLKFAKMMEAARQGAKLPSPAEPNAEEQAAPAVDMSDNLVEKEGGRELRVADQGPGQGENKEGSWEVVAPNVGGDAFEGSEPPMGDGLEGWQDESSIEEERDTSSEDGTESSGVTSKSSGESELMEPLEGVEGEVVGGVPTTETGKGRVTGQDHLGMAPSNNDGQAQENTFDIPLIPTEQATDVDDKETVDQVSTRPDKDEEGDISTVAAAIDVEQDDSGPPKHDQSSYNGVVGPSPVPSVEAESPAAAGLVSAEPWQDLAALASETNTVVPELSLVGKAAQGWETHVDDVTGRVYYFHPESQTTSWEPPNADIEGEPAIQENKAVHTDGGGSNSDSAVNVESPTTPEEADRGRSRSSPHEEESSRTRQEKEVTQPRHDTQHVPPASNLEAPRQAGEEEQEETTTPLGEDANNTGPVSGSGDQALFDAVEGGSTAGDGGAAQGEWQEIVDSSSGSKYFYNSATKESAWELPTGAVVKAAGAVAAVGAYEADETPDNDAGRGINGTGDPRPLGKNLAYPGASADLELDYS